MEVNTCTIMTKRFSLPEGFKIPIFFGPSGVGKSTLVNHVIDQIVEVTLSISDTTRHKREYEINKIHYYFRNKQEFQSLILAGAFIEFEEVYKGVFYGTRFGEIKRLYDTGRTPVMDIDVKGAKNLFSKYPNNFVPVLVSCPLELIPDRLIKRGTEDDADLLKQRIEKAKSEIEEGESFAVHIILNTDLDQAKDKAFKIVKEVILQNHPI